jgi:hypothetical protein
MSQYFGNQDLFNSPEVKQYGSHMVMTNVMQPTKIKYLNIDSRYGDDFSITSLANYNITLPERIENVQSIKVRCAEIPISFYNFSNQLDNNVFKVSTSTVNEVLALPDGFYDNVGFVNNMNAILSASPAPLNQLTFSLTKNKSVFTNNSGVPITVQFDISPLGTTDYQNMTYKLGWLLGFRETDYTLQPGESITSTAFLDLNTPRYLFLVVNEFTNGNPYSFMTMLQNSEINKSQILARIAMDYTNYPFGTVLHASQEQGYIVSDERKYSGPVNLQRMNVQLVNERGVIMNLNGLDLSFCLELHYE